MSTLYWKDVNGRNWPVCSCLKAWLTAYQNELLRRGIIKHGLDLYQTIGGAQASAGYHLYGGCVDTGQTSTEAIRVARNMGGAAFGRDSRDGMDVHCHIALKGCPHMRYGPNWQVTELEAGRDGLANRGRDRGPRTGIKWPLRTWQQGIAWAKEQAVPSYTDYYVKAPFAQGHTSASATSPLVGNKKPWGSRLRVLKTKTVNGAKWAWVDPAGYPGRWYPMALLTTSKPTNRIQKVGTLTVGEYNVAAQAKGHAGTYPKRAPLSAQRMVDKGADVIGVVEYGSDAVEHPNGLTYLRISDDARKAASDGNLVRVAHGDNWRHILRRLDTTDYIPESGRAVTLPTRVDANGTQIVMAGILKDGVKTGLVVFHFDVNSTDAQFKAQARETLIAGESWRREFGIQPWNMTYTGDHNCTTSTVRGIFSTWGFVSTARRDPQGKYRTTNSWTNVLTVGPRRDDTFVFEGADEAYHLWLDAVAADHNYTQSVRALYGRA